MLPVIALVGSSGSGKSTVANVLRTKLLQAGGRSVTLLDGDIVRKNLSSELGFSKEHRDLNILRIGFVASEITKNGGIAICAPIAPYAATRRAVREDIEAFGAFVEVHVATSLEECERRDPKGLYARARRGELRGLTGVDDPYEEPLDPECTIGRGESIEESVNAVVALIDRLSGPAQHETSVPPDRTEPKREHPIERILDLARWAKALFEGEASTFEASFEPQMVGPHRFEILASGRGHHRQAGSARLRGGRRACRYGLRYRQPSEPADHAAVVQPPHSSQQRHGFGPGGDRRENADGAGCGGCRPR